MTYLKNNLNKFLIISFSIFVFFFDFLKEFVDLRMVIFFPFFLSIYEQIINYKRINIKYLAVILFVIILFIIQGQIYNSNYDDKIYNLNQSYFC